MRRMENHSMAPTQAPIKDSDAKETSKPITVYGYTEPDEPKIPPPPDLTNTGPGGPIVVRTEEVLIVVFVLILWAGAIALFFNRWGKIRMLEPYQPKFHEEEHRPSCPLNELTNPVIAQHRTSLSKYNVTAGSCVEPSPILYQTPPTAHRNLLRSRQNSVFTGTSISPSTSNFCCPRKTRSAMDINSLVLHETSSSRPGSSILPTSSSASSNRRSSYAHHSSTTLKDKRSCSLFPPGGHDRRRSCMGECSIVSLRDRYGNRDSLSPHLPHSFRRVSCATDSDYLSCPTRERDRKPSFNNVIAQVAQVTTERRPSSSMLRMSNV